MIPRKPIYGIIDMNYIPVESESDLETIDQLSRSTPVLIFKHSTRCATSMVAADRLRRSWNDREMLQMKAYQVNVISDRELSNKIMYRYNIQHQSPQVLLIYHGECIYHNSHFGIEYNELRNFVNQQFGNIFPSSL